MGRLVILILVTALLVLGGWPFPLDTFADGGGTNDIPWSPLLGSGYVAGGRLPSGTTVTPDTIHVIERYSWGSVRYTLANCPLGRCYVWEEKPNPSVGARAFNQFARKAGLPHRMGPPKSQPWSGDSTGLRLPKDPQAWDGVARGYGW